MRHVVPQRANRIVTVRYYDVPRKCSLYVYNLSQRKMGAVCRRIVEGVRIFLFATIGSVLLAVDVADAGTSGFVDDVMFSQIDLCDAYSQVARAETS